jgi:hypothetical protein
MDKQFDASQDLAFSGIRYFLMKLSSEEVFSLSILSEEVALFRDHQE